MYIIDSRYEIIERIDVGYRSKLYTAIDLYTNSTVLVKLIDKGIITNKNFISNFIDETTILNEDHCENIVKTLDIGIFKEDDEDEYTYYIVSEYIHGSGLDKFTKYMDLNLEQSISIFRQLVKAIEIAHKHDIYHGDIQPHNIIIDEGLTAKLNNFGFVSSNNNIFKSNLEQTVKNIKYLSPQQLCIGYTDKQCDFYSLGLVMFELILKTYPYEGNIDTCDELLSKMDKGIDWKNIDKNGVPDDIINILKKLLSRTDKYSNCQQIMIDLSKYLYIEIDNEKTQEFKTLDNLENTNIYSNLSEITNTDLEKTVIYKKKKKFKIFAKN